jgi:glyoxylase-like metal-dependent hydrolase (beta-lactamase superfamily II)
MKRAAVSSILVVLLALHPGAARADTDSTTFRSWQRARTVLAKAIEAHGGLEKLRAIDNASVEYDGLRTMINQSRRAEPPWDKEPASGKFVVDRKGQRMYALTSTAYPGLGSFTGALAIKGTEGFHWEPPKNHHGSEVIAKLSGADTDGPWASAPRWIPPLLLLAAWDNGTNLRWIEAFEKEGRKFEAIAFVERDKRHLVLLIDAGTCLLEGYESIRDDGVYGDVTDFTRLHGYTSVAGVKFPTRRTEYLNGEVARELNLRFSVDTALDDRLFELPEGYSMPNAAAENAPRIRKIGEGVYIDIEMGAIMIVEFEAYLLIVECPDSFWMAQSTIDAVKEAIPGKPIRYVVPSHTHGDHGGGARAYFHAGTTLITTRGNVGFYEKLATIRQTIRPDPLTSNPRAPVIEVFERKRVITDGTQTVELHDVGPNAHSEELTIAYLPKQKILWQADLAIQPFTGGGVNAALPITVEFAKKLKKLGLAKFERMVEAHHSRIITRAEFEESLAKAARPR